MPNMLTPPISGATAAQRLAAVARIEVSGEAYDWYRPFAHGESFQSFGSAGLISLLAADESKKAQTTEKVLHLLTAYHVVHNAEGIWATFANVSGQSFPAEVVGACPEIDVALLCVKDVPLAIRSQLKPFELGDSDTLQPQQPVVAAGFPRAQNTVKTVQGVVSGRQNGRIQVDASVNQGNSGGPLLDTASGLLVGIVTSGERDAVGMNYATPIKQVQVRMEGLQRGFEPLPSFNMLTSMATPTLLRSVGLDNNDNNTQIGSFIRYVHPESHCYKSGMRSGDILLALHTADNQKLPVGLDNGVTVPWWPSPVTLDTLRSRLRVGDTISLEYWSSAQQKTVLHKATLESERFVMREYYERYEEPDYEAYGGLVVMQLALNHLRGNGNGSNRGNVWAEMFAYLQQQTEQRAKPILVLTNVLPSSSLRSLLHKSIAPADIIVAVNDINVQSLEQYRAALKKPIVVNGVAYIVWQTRDGMKTVLEKTVADREHKKWLEE